MAPGQVRILEAISKLGALSCCFKIGSNIFLSVVLLKPLAIEQKRFPSLSHLFHRSIVQLTVVD